MVCLYREMPFKPFRYNKQNQIQCLLKFYNGKYVYVPVYAYGHEK